MTVLLEKATRQHTKTHNSTLVLRAIYESAGLSRADIARMTSLTRATVSEVVAELIDRSLVEEIGHGPTNIGRTPVLLDVAADARQIIGIDLAGGELRGALLNLRGEARHVEAMPLPEGAGDAALSQVFALIDGLLARTDRALLGIGIGAPGLIDAANGEVRRAVNLNWQNLPLRAVLRERYELPVHVANDSHLAALAEYTFGQGPRGENMVVLQVGRGVGAGIVLGGRLYYGDSGGAGEIGHVVVAEGGPLCRCGNRGCLEAVASARAIVERAGVNGELATLERLAHACARGDLFAQGIVREAGHALGVAVAQIAGMLNIRHVVIAGPVALLGEPLLHTIREALDARLLGSLAREVELALGSIGPEAVVLGASALVLSSELGLPRLRRAEHASMPTLVPPA